MVNRLSSEERMERAHEIGVIVDPEDEWLLGALTWQLVPKGYVESTAYDGVWRKTVKLHHYIMGTPVHPWVIDHVNRDKLDNRRSNLRYIDPHGSIQNSDRVEQAANMRIDKSGRYEVRVQRNGRMHQVGTFSTEQEAIDARTQWFSTQTDRG